MPSGPLSRRGADGAITPRRANGALSSMQSLQSALGVFAILAIAWLISENRRAVPWRPVLVGLAITFFLALLMLKVPQVKVAFAAISDAVEAIAAATRAGTAFV